MKKYFPNIHLVILLLFISLNSYAQSNTYIDEVVSEVYHNLNEAIGDGSHDIPTLVMSGNNKSVANYIPNGNKIEFEYKAYQICRKMGKDSLNAVAFILSHELGHYYRDHKWLLDVGSSYAGTELGDKLELAQESIDTTIRYETEADEYSCFYSKIAGYSIVNAPQLLDSLYKGYSFPNKINRYPSLDDRKKIALTIEKQTSELYRLYDIASIMMLKGEYRCASILYKNILNKRFGSREIFNNIGVSYALEGLKYANDKYKDLAFPFSIDLSSRLSENHRGTELFDSLKAASYFNRAKEMFEKSKKLDGHYLPAKINLAIVSALNSEFRFAYYLLSELEEMNANDPNEKLKIEYTRALVDLISRKENAIDNIKTFALKDNLAFITINRLNHVDSSKTIQTSNDDSLFLNLSKDFNRSKFVDLPIKRITGEGNVIIYTKDSLNIRYSILEFKSSGGFGRVFYFVEVDPSQMSINYRNNLFVNEFKYGSYKIVKNHCKSYDLYHKILDGNSERTFIDVN
jgi:hypothetical protein